MTESMLSINDLRVISTERPRKNYHPNPQPLRRLNRPGSRGDSYHVARSSPPVTKSKLGRDITPRANVGVLRL